MAEEREEEVRTADGDADEDTSPVVWRYDPQEDHLLGASLPGVPRSDLTADRVEALGLDEKAIEDSGLYKKAEGTVRPRRRSRRAEGE